MKKDRAFLEIEFIAYISIALIISLGLLMSFKSLVTLSNRSINDADCNIRAEYVVNLMEKELRRSSKVYLIEDKIIFYKHGKTGIDDIGGFLLKYELKKDHLYRVSGYYNCIIAYENINYFSNSFIGNTHITGDIEEFKLEVSDDLILIEIRLGNIRKTKLLENSMELIYIGGESYK